MPRPPATQPSAPPTTPGQRPVTGKDHRREALELLRAQLAAGRDLHTVEIRHGA